MYKRVECWSSVYFLVYFHDKTGSCCMDFKNERKLMQKIRKFDKSKEDDGDRSNQPQLEESSEDAEERYVDTNFEYCLKFCDWLKNTGFISSLEFLFLKVLCASIVPCTCFWGVLQCFTISKLLRITVLKFLFVSSSFINAGLVSAKNITLGHNIKNPYGYLNLRSTGK